MHLHMWIYMYAWTIFISGDLVSNFPCDSRCYLLTETFKNVSLLWDSNFLFIEKSSAFQLIQNSDLLLFITMIWHARTWCTQNTQIRKHTQARMFIADGWCKCNWHQPFIHNYKTIILCKIDNAIHLKCAMANMNVK